MFDLGADFVWMFGYSEMFEAVREFLRRHRLESIAQRFFLVKGVVSVIVTQHDKFILTPYDYWNQICYDTLEEVFWVFILTLDRATNATGI